jgi:hypothetical protein
MRAVLPDAFKRAAAGSIRVKMTTDGSVADPAREQTGLRYFVKPICLCVRGRSAWFADVRGAGPDDPAVLDQPLHADNTRVDRGTPLSPSSPSATGLSARAPEQRAGAQRLCALALMRSRARADMTRGPSGAMSWLGSRKPPIPSRDEKECTALRKH